MYFPLCPSLLLISLSLNNSSVSTNGFTVGNTFKSRTHSITDACSIKIDGCLFSLVNRQNVFQKPKTSIDYDVDVTVIYAVYLEII